MIASQVQVKLINAELMGNFYFTKEPVALAQKMLAGGLYTIEGEFAVEGVGEAAAEEVFDLTNNPSRQDEREQLYGRKRSVSVGDIVTVEGVDYLCASMGWETL